MDFFLGVQLHFTIDQFKLINFYEKSFVAAGVQHKEVPLWDLRSG